MRFLQFNETGLLEKKSMSEKKQDVIFILKGSNKQTQAPWKTGSYKETSFEETETSYLGCMSDIIWEIDFLWANSGIMDK